jgi:CO/xanthine dehydrogenase Mo-binding subunit
MPDQVFMKILFAQRVHAVVRKIETHDAAVMDGVLAVYTAADVPVNEYGLTMKDQPVLCGPGSDKPFTDRVRFVGDQVAVVIAETEEIASRACELIAVDYEDLPVIVDPEEAMKKDATLLHPNHESNVVLGYKIRKGDMAKGFAEADVIVEGEYRTPAQEHAYLAPEAGLGYIDDEGRVTVAVAGQWVHTEQVAIAHALDLPLDKVRVIHPAIGGAFGGREDISVQIVLALAALRLHQQGIDRPVKLIWSREESIVGHHKRHPYLIRAKWGATKDGKIVAAESEIIADSGAYNYTSNKVLGNAHLMVTGPYEIEHVKVDSYAVYTNNIPRGAFRGFGGPQAAFACEMQVSKLADALDMDPVEFRMRNVARDGSLISVNTPLPEGVTLEKVIEECALVSGWEKGEDRWQRNVKEEELPEHIRRGVGFASGFKNIGFSLGFPERSWATVELHGETEIEKVVVHHAGADVGQGAHTVFQQMAAEAVGVSFENVELVVADTAFTGDSGSSSASRMTFMAGNAIKGAGEAALQKWREEERPSIAEYKYEPPKTTPYDNDTGESNPNFAYGYVAETVTLEVDTDTGEIRIFNVICADDVGKAINPQQIEGQVEGAIAQAMGWTLMENFIEEGGVPQTTLLSTYLIPTVLDVPDKVESVILENNDKVGPWGAKGMGEMPYIPFAPAVMAALHAATGVWFDEFPLTPERVLRKLGKL